jgi:hypothetical protein
VKETSAMTNHPTPTPPPATPEVRVPDLGEVIRQATEEILLAAKHAQGKRDQLAKDAEWDHTQAREDEQEIAEAVRTLNEARARLTDRQRRMAARDAEIRTLDEQIARLESEGRKGDALFEQYGQGQGPAAATRTDAGQPIGAIKQCPGCGQPIVWDGLAWTHATVTDCTADLAAVSPQQGGGQA